MTGRPIVPTEFTAEMAERLPYWTTLKGVRVYTQPYGVVWLITPADLARIAPHMLNAAPAAGDAGRAAPETRIPDTEANPS